MPVTDRDYQVFKLAVWYTTPPVRRAIWPVLVTLLPIIWKIVLAWLESRDAQNSGTLDTIGQIRMAARRLGPEFAEAVARAERNVPRA